jgi:hypothetical protein
MQVTNQCCSTLAADNKFGHGNAKEGPIHPRVKDKHKGEQNVLQTVIYFRIPANALLLIWPTGHGAPWYGISTEKTTHWINYNSYSEKDRYQVRTVVYNTVPIFLNYDLGGKKIDGVHEPQIDSSYDVIVL